MGARRANGPPDVCEYNASSEGGVAATLRLTFTQRSLANGMQQVWADSLRKGGGTPLVGFEDRAFVFVNAQQGCRSVVARRASDIAEVVRCGPAYDSAEAARRADGVSLMVESQGNPGFCILDLTRRLGPLRRWDK